MRSLGYQLTKEISRGAFGVVFTAWMENKRVAFKITSCKIPKVRENHAKEVASLYMLRGKPNVVQILDNRSIDSWDYIIMEQMEGDLGEFLKTKRLSREKCIDYFFQILSGVEAIHDMKLIHRDLKTPNILIRGDEIKVGDLGSCIMQDANRTMTNPITTLWYRAPEVLFGSRNYGWEIDIWALACIFWEMSEGVPLFSQDDDFLQLKEVIQYTGLPPDDSPLWDFGVKKSNLEGIPRKELRFRGKEGPILKRMLSLDPEERPEITEILEVFNEL